MNLNISLDIRYPVQLLAKIFDQTLLNLQYCLKGKEVVVPPVFLVAECKRCECLETSPGHQRREGTLLGLLTGAVHGNVRGTWICPPQTQPSPGQRQQTVWWAQPSDNWYIRWSRKSSPQELQAVLLHHQTAAKDYVPVREVYRASPCALLQGRVDFVDIYLNTFMLSLLPSFKQLCIHQFFLSFIKGTVHQFWIYDIFFVPQKKHFL